MSKAQQIGYKRVSTVDQSNARQLDGLTLDRMFEDKASGKDTKRPQLEAALSFVRDGDTLVVHSMDRLARNLDDLRKIVLTLTKRGVKVQFVKESLIFTGEDSPMANLLLSMLGAVAQFERELIRERQREGIAIAKKEGVYKGRQPSLSPERAEQLRARIAAGKANKAELAKQFGISRAIRIATGTIVDATIIAAPSSTRNASGDQERVFDQERVGRAGSGDALGQEGQPVALRAEGAYRRGREGGPCALGGDLGRACVGRAYAAGAAAWRRTQGVGRRRLSGPDRVQTEARPRPSARPLRMPRT